MGDFYSMISQNHKKKWFCTNAFRLCCAWSKERNQIMRWYILFIGLLIILINKKESFQNVW
jgi:hypothetical protein